MSTGTFLLFPHHRPRLGEPAGGQLYPVHSAALVLEHFKTPHQIAEALLLPIEIKAGATITSSPTYPWGPD